MQLLLEILLLTIGIVLAGEEKRVVCYYRWKHNGLAPTDLPEGCTHLILCFVTISTEMTLNLSQVENATSLKQFVDSYDSTRTRTKIIFSVGGAGSDGAFSKMASSENTRKTFIDASKKLISDTGMDGIDLDWEFPSLFERSAFDNLLEEMSEALDGLSNVTGKNYVLSVAVPGAFTMTAGFSSSTINKYCTFVNVMAYDLLLHDGLFVKWATFHSSLHLQTSIVHPYSWYTVESSMAAWRGIDKEKLNLGLPTYAVGYHLCDPKKTSHLSCIDGYSGLGANINYAKICAIREMFPENDRWHKSAEAPYIFDNQSNWFTYDNEKSIALKTKYAVEKGFGGLMVFSLNADDHLGRCGGSGKRFPLLKAALANWT